MSVQPGMEIPLYVMSSTDMERVHTLMELMHDTNPVHDNPELVAKRKLRGPVNQGPANLSYMMNMLFAWAGTDMFLERMNFRFHNIVVPGDVVTARGTVTSVEDAGDELRVGCDIRLEHEDGSVAVAGTAWLRMRKADD